MADRLKIEGNFLVIFEDGTPSTEYVRGNVAFVGFSFDPDDNVTFFETRGLPIGRGVNTFEGATIIDDRTGSAFTDVPELKRFLSEKLGGASTVVSSSAALRIVSVKGDFPAPVSGVITLADEVTYFVVDHIDLTGDRLVSGSNTTLLGASSENCSLTSTGLGSTTPLLTIEYTTPIRHITIKDVGTALAVDGTARTVALDWTGVNFLNVPTVGLFNTLDNFIFTKGAFLNSGRMSFTGTAGTIAFNNSLFNSDSANTIFDLQAGLVVSRRFRVIYSSFIVLSGETGVDVDASATLPNEGLILDTCNFAGGGTYLSGVDYQDNIALFVNNVGITNSREVSNYYMNGNATATAVASAGVAYKVAGSTTSNSAVTSKFTNTDNRATYTGSLVRDFIISASLSVESGNNNQIGCYIAKNGSVLAESEIYITTNAAGRAEAAKIQAVTNLGDTDFIEVFVENETAATDITVTDLNVIIR